MSNNNKALQNELLALVKDAIDSSGGTLFGLNERQLVEDIIEAVEFDASMKEKEREFGEPVEPFSTEPGDYPPA